MATQKRRYEEVDPDYADACDQQNKRQRELEQDAKQVVIKKVQGIIRNEFKKEINNKEMELHQVDRRLNEARLMMDRLRACIVSTYYGQINNFGTSEVSKMNGPPPSIHPAVKKHLGKTPSQYDMKPDTPVSQMQQSSESEVALNEESEISSHQRNQSREEQQIRTSELSSAYQSSATGSSNSIPLIAITTGNSADATYDDRRDRLKIKKKIIIGNVSKYIPVDHREANDKSSHKWMMYVRGPKSEPDISGFVKKVWFFLHHSYKPNDLVEISSPPFHLTRRGWGEFPVRVQLHFVDPRNKKVDIIHQLKLDKTFSGLQTLGAETMVELDLEKDFFEFDTNSSSSYIKLTPSCSFSTSSSSYHQDKLSSSSILKAATSASDKHMVSSQNGRILSSEYSQKVLSRKSEADCSVVDVTSESQNVVIETEAPESCKAGLPELYHDIFETDGLADGLENNSMSMDEYHMTIVHDTDEREDHCRQKEKVQKDAAVSDKPETVAEMNSANSSLIPDLPGCMSSLDRVQRVLPSVIPSTKATLTIINKPQWINPDNSYTSNKSDLAPVTLQIPQVLSKSTRSHSATSESLKPVNTANVAISEPAKCLQAQPCSYILLDKNGYIKPTSSSQAVLSSLPSLPFSLSVLPVSKTAPVVTAPVICSGQSLSLPQNVPLTVVGPPLVPLPQHVHQNQSSIQSSDAKKVIIVKPNTSVNTPQVASTNSTGAESKSVLQPKISRPRQVSLLTGKVFTPQTPPTVVNKISTPNHGSSDTLLANNCVITKQISNQAVAVGKSANQITKSTSGAQLLLLKPVNNSSLSLPPLGPHTSTNHIKNVSSLVRQGPTSQVVNVSIVNPEGSAEKSASSSSLLNNCLSINNPILQSSQTVIKGSNIILHVPGQGHHQLVDTQDFNTQMKMSAIGITKHGKSTTAVPVVSTNLKSATDEERKQNQYEVLMAWKRNRHLNKQEKEVVRVSRDRIVGEADVIPELNLNDYTNMRALVKAAVRLHPLVQAGVNKLTHPYCAESLEQWNTWNLGKQLASEWHRSCFTLKYMKALVGESGCFRGEQLMTTRQLVRWCRLHAFSPFVAVVKSKPVTIDESTCEISSQNCSHTPSFTPVESLQMEMMAEDIGEDNSRQELDVVDVADIDAGAAKKMASRSTEPGDTGTSMEWLPLSDGAVFVSDELRKRGIKLQPSELEPGVMANTAADMLYMAMQEFVADVLRETMAVSMQQMPHSSTVEITRQDVHKALTKLPEAAFSCSRFLGKTDVGHDASGR